MAAKFAIAILLIAGGIQLNHARPRASPDPAWWNDVAKTVTGLVNDAGREIEKGYNSVAHAVGGAIDDTGKFFDDAGKEIKKFSIVMGFVGNIAGKEIDKAVTNTAKEIAKTVDKAVDEAGKFFNDVGQVITRGYNEVAKFIDDAADSVKDAAKSLSSIIDEVVEVGKAAMKKEDFVDGIIYVIDAIEDRAKRIQHTIDEVAESSVEGSDNPAFKLINAFGVRVGSLVSEFTGLQNETTQCAVQKMGDLYKNVARDGAQCVTDMVVESTTILRSIVQLIPKAREIIEDVQDIIKTWKDNISTLIAKIKVVFQKAIELGKNAAIYFAQGAEFILTFKASMAACASGMTATVAAKLAEVTSCLVIELQARL